MKITFFTISLASLAGIGGEDWGCKIEFVRPWASEAALMSTGSAVLEEAELVQRRLEIFRKRDCLSCARSGRKTLRILVTEPPHIGSREKRKPL